MVPSGTAVSSSGGRINKIPIISLIKIPTATAKPVLLARIRYGQLLVVEKSPGFGTPAVVSRR
jgi:hypothetical protein